MAERIAPNPPSPYADADPQYRHLIPSFFGLGSEPGVLAVAACGYMVVAPEQQREALNFRDLPDGICPQCIDEATGKLEETGPHGRLHNCTRCSLSTRHEDICALCRQQLHDEWRAEQPAEAPL